MTDFTICKIDGCGNPARHMGWCRPHYRRWNRYGDPLAGGPRHYANPEEAIAARTIKDERTGCVEWIGSSDRRGYGQIRINGTSMKAHRVSWAATNGPIPDGALVLHRCDNPACINPDHLFLGDHKANVDDMDAKGRRVNAQHKGSRCPGSKLSEANIPAIRADRRTQHEIAKSYGISQSVVSKIKLHQAWAHVK